MLVDEDLSKCRMLNNAEMLALIHCALLANSWGLPSFRVATEDRRQRDAAVRMFAAEVTAQLLSNNTRLVQGPASVGAKTSGGVRLAHTVDCETASRPF